ncbi:MAG: hypothetical protein CL893_01235, partial [Dehalococcoidia bacterium]|nr:hypothetical protein [Dehalococcoidia bacterium]
MKKITIFIFLLFIFACSNNSKSSINSNFVENKSSQLVDSEYKVDRNDEDSESSNDNEFGSGQQKSKSSENEELDDSSYVLAIDFNPESGNYIRANYRVKEQLARLPSPIEAVGYTESITGGIYIDSQGNPSDNSVINIDLSTLRSDESRRDNYLRGSSLETDKFPQATFKVLDIQGLDLSSLISS